MTSKIRIGFMIQYLSIGGIETRMLKLLKNIDRDRFDPVLICAQDDGMQADEFGSLNVPIITTRGLFPVNRFIQFYEVMQVLKALKFKRLDVLISFLPTSQPFENLFALIGVRNQSFAFGLVINFRMGRDKDWEYRAQIAKRIISVSAGAADAIFGGSPYWGKIKVIHNGVDTELFNKLRYKIQDSGVDVSSPIVISCIARLAPQKRYDVLIEALAILRDNGVKFSCIIAGQDRLDGKFQKMVIDKGLQGVISYVGPTNDAPGILAKSDIFVLTSDNEGCPNSVLEAMATGIPVVVTNSGAEEFVEDGVTGFVAPLGDAVAIAEKIERLACDTALRIRMGADARAWILRNASLEKMLIDYFQLFEEMAVAGSKGRP